MPSKMVTDRQAVGAQVSAAIDTHAGEAAAALDRQVRSLLGEGVTEIEELLGTVRRLFDRHLALLVEADEAHLATVGNLADPRRGRDEAVARLSSALVEVRRLAEGLYGERAEELLRLGGAVSQNPVVLLRQARRVVARVADAGTPRPPKRFDSASVDEAEWLERLEPEIEALEQALSRVRFGRRQMESTLRAKNEALAAYDVAFGRTARFMEALLDLSGLSSFASRLRPPVTRRGTAGGGVVIELPQPAPPAEPEATDGT
ncbi:MAG TPA: hypothetical protein VHM02_00825, partial [Thermoanaerobaculia bacterium]|nr:hypothetical protein [Thermoanaerobaculia bacterium]